MHCLRRTTLLTDRRLIVPLSALAVAMAVGSAPAGIVVNVTRAGFPSMGESDIVRSGAWVPVIVDLELVGQSEFFGTVRVAQRDGDGDECFDSVGVHLRAESGGALRVMLYALANPVAVGNQGRFVVELFDGDGNAVEILTQTDTGGPAQPGGSSVYRAQTSQRSETVPDDEILILSVSTGVMGRVQELLTMEGGRAYARRIRLGHMSPSELPELWIGLEIVDHIVWDDPHPENLTERQTQALLEWVNQGGTLLIAASRSIGSLRMSQPLRDALPVELADVVSVENLPGLRQTLIDKPARDEKTSTEFEWWEMPFPKPVLLTKCTRRDGADSIYYSVKHQTDVVSRRGLGRGQIVFCGVTLDDLFSAPGGSRKFYERLLNLQLRRADAAPADPRSLFQNVVSAVAFNRRAGLYLMMVGFGSIGYVLLATFGSWTLLGRRGLRKHAWSAFALVGLGGTLASVFAVNSVRGFGGETLHQISVIDGEAGEMHGLATVYFGLKTAVDKRLDLWLPSDPLGATEPERTNCVLRPIPVAGSEISETFADPVDYRLVPASGQLQDVRVRGTLKRLEGRWEGSIDGTVTGEISIRGKDLGSRILPGSYVVNELGVDLRNCYLIHTARDLSETSDFRSEFIYAFPLGNIAAGARIDLVERCYTPNRNEQMVKFLARSTLAEAQKHWGAGITSLLRNTNFGITQSAAVVLGEEENALLLLSTIGEYDFSLDTGAVPLSFGAGRTWSRDRARQLDLRGQLRRGTVMLVGFCDDPGPVRLFRRSGDDPYRPLAPDPENSWTMYRFRIPATLLRGSVDEDEEYLSR